MTRSFNGSMFWRVWWRAVSVKRSQAALALGSLVVGAAITSMLLNLYGDVRRKMTEDFRAYGANVVIAAVSMGAGGVPDSKMLEEVSLQALARFASQTTGTTFAPVLYGVVRVSCDPADPRLPEFTNVVAAGVDFGALRRFNPGWQETGEAAWADLPPGDCAVGSHLAARLHLRVGDSLDLRRVPPGVFTFSLAPLGERGDRKAVGEGALTSANSLSQVCVPPFGFDALTRRVPAGESAGCAPPSPPKGSGSENQTNPRRFPRIAKPVVPNAEIPAGGRRPPPQTAEGESASISATFRIAAILTTGASEDDQVFLPLAALQSFLGMKGKVTVVELSIPGETRDVETAVHRLASLLPGLEVRPIRQIVYSEGKVLGTVRWLLLSLTILILVIIALCVMATMTAIVLECRKDIGVMKALGASDSLLMRLFMAEGAGLGLLGGALGYVLGAVLARALGERLFGVTLSLHMWTLPIVCGLTVALAVLAAPVPVRIVRGIQPTAVLRGE